MIFRGSNLVQVSYHIFITCEGVQNSPPPNPQDGPFWHVNYFELKTIETLRAQEKLLSLPQLPRKI